MKTILIAILLAAALVTTAPAQPSINNNGILNVASYALPGLPNASIAQGSIFVIFGAGMGPGTLVQATTFPIPFNLGGTSVTVTAGGQTFQAPVVYTSAGQVAAIMPSKVPVGSVTVTVSFGGATSASRTVQVISSSVGVFALNQQGNGSGVITNANFQIFLGNSAARPGDAAIIWATGLGPVPFDDAAAPQVLNLSSIPVEVFVGGRKLASTAYQGRSGCCSGLDQIVFTVPAGIEGCSVPVTVKINNVVSNTTTMPITSNSNRVCSDPNGIAAGDLQNLLGMPSFNLGSVLLNRSSFNTPLPPPFGGTTTTDTGSASFIKFTPIAFSGATQGFQQPAIGSCIVYILTSSSGSSGSSTFAGLDAGAAINVNGPKGPKQLLPTPNFKGFYSGTLSSGTPPAPVTLYLDPGSYKIDNGSGGVDVKGFSFNMTVPDLLTWTNMTQVTSSAINRAQGVTVTWTGGAPGTFAVITGTSSLTGPPSVTGYFICYAPVEQLSFTVGPDVLLQLPQSTVTSGGGFTIPSGSLSVGNTSLPIKFTAPGIDYGSAFTMSSSGTLANYQ